LNHAIDFSWDSIAQFNDLEQLVLMHSGLKNIVGIERFDKLRILHLEGNHLTDISPLNSLTNL